MPIAKIQPHPDNPNKQDERTRERIKRHIGETNQYQSLLVRTLEESQRFADEHAAGFIQLLDGEQRLDILRELGHKEIRCEVWEGITDARAMLLLASFNHGGEDDAMARAALVRKIVEAVDDDIERISAYIPDSTGDISKYLEHGLTDDERRQAGGPTETVSFQAAVGGGGRKGGYCLQIFLPNRAKEAELTELINAWLAKYDPGRGLSFREGEALLGLAREGAKAIR